MQLLHLNEKIRLARLSRSGLRFNQKTIKLGWYSKLRLVQDNKGRHRSRTALRPQCGTKRQLTLCFHNRLRSWELKAVRIGRGLSNTPIVNKLTQLGLDAARGLHQGDYKSNEQAMQTQKTARIRDKQEETGLGEEYTELYDHHLCMLQRECRIALPRRYLSTTAFL